MCSKGSFSSRYLASADLDASGGGKVELQTTSI